MKSIKLIIVLITIVFSFAGCDAKINNPKTETYKVYGNCNTCKKRIEKVIKDRNNAKGNWNTDSKILTLTYDTKKTNADEVLKRIADIGHDNDKFAANDVGLPMNGCNVVAAFCGEAACTGIP